MTAAGWDVAVFRAIHLGMHQRWLDPVMKFLTDPGAWKIPILVVVGSLFLLRGRRGLVGVLVLALTIAAGDQLSSHVLKKIVKRPRPSVTLPDSQPLFGRRGTHSFPSTHAVNFFAAAPVVSAVFPEAAAAAYGVAAAVSFSRIYVGDHYPSDVLAGAALGFGLGWLGRRLYRRLMRTLLRNRAAPEESIPLTERDERAPSAVP
ncbi:MAG TPA: phosphatase PAP2 family protein [Candidatus Polarisedimenticolia bacterium]|nr:phosphatase PAP2 family protein [Candidatus Polarisedimenticolia bacterium]